MRSSMNTVAAVVVILCVLACVSFVFLNAAGCATDPIETGSPSEIQELRVNHCERVLTPETCRVMVRQNHYKSIGDCNHAFHQGRFCAPPISSTIQEMNDCALRIGRDWSVPDECLKLRHE